MKIIHTADWHLGKTLKGQSLIDDQKFILDQIFYAIDDQKPDALLICGDIFDRGVPPIDAVDLFDETLNKLAEKNIPTLIIAGNHDSATRLNFGSKIFESKQIFIAAKAENAPAQTILEDKFGEIYFSLIPYVQNADYKFYIETARQKIPAGKRSVALAHIFLTGGIESESERKFVGGAENVDSNLFNGYNYVALGHLHRPQKISAENIRYAGSPLKYSFDEADHKKSLTIIDLDGEGNINIEKFPLKPRRDVRVVKGNIRELLKNRRTEDYICAQLTERVINVQDKLSGVFPNLLNVEFLLQKDTSEEVESKIFHEGTSTLDYFADFFQDQTKEPLSLEYREAMGEFLSKMEMEE